MPMVAKYLKLLKSIEKKVQERMEGPAQRIQQGSQGSAARFAADFPVSQHPIFQFSKQAVTSPNKWASLHGSLFYGGRWKEEKCCLHCNFESHRAAMHSHPQRFPGVWRGQCREEGKGYAIFSSIEGRVVGQLSTAASRNGLGLLKIRGVRQALGTSVPNCPPKSCVWR